MQSAATAIHSAFDFIGLIKIMIQSETADPHPADERHTHRDRRTDKQIQLRYKITDHLLCLISSEYLR